MNRALIAAEVEAERLTSFVAAMHAALCHAQHETHGNAQIDHALARVEASLAKIKTHLTKEDSHVAH
jgi:hypothetical protein